MMRWILLFVSVCAAGMGCATCPDVRQQLKQSEQTIEMREKLIEQQRAVISEKEGIIEDKNETISTLKNQIDELDRRLNISNNEQDRYDERIQQVTSEVRSFVKKQIQQSRSFLTNIALEDFVGFPLIARENMDTDASMVVDLAHPVPGKGQINGIGGYFKGSGSIVVKLMRPVGSDYIVTYNKTLALDAAEAAKRLIDFDSPIMVNKGDVVAYYLPESISVAYDREIGVSSYFRAATDEFPVGERIQADALWKQKQPKRKYSLNYYGIFVQN